MSIYWYVDVCIRLYVKRKTNARVINVTQEEGYEARWLQ